MPPRSTTRPAEPASASPRAAPTRAAAPRRAHLAGTSVSAPLNINVFAAPEAVARPPTALPPFTVGDIRAAIPAHLFVRSAFWSFAYLARDLLAIAALAAAATRIAGAPAAAQWALWPLYWYAQGCVMTGVWVLAHECGHQSFSPSKALNDSVGWLLHSALLVPYHSWRISHKNHHSYTCSVEHDEVFAASTRSSYVQEAMRESPLGTAVQIFVMLTFGWCVWAGAPGGGAAGQCAHVGAPASLPPPPPPPPVQARVPHFQRGGPDQVRGQGEQPLYPLVRAL